MLVNELIGSARFEILAADFHRLDTWWNFDRVNSPFSRLYYVTEGRVNIRHHGCEFILPAGTIHFIPCYTFCDLHCPEQFGHYHIEFSSRLPGGIDLLSIISCSYQRSGSMNDLAHFQRIFELTPEIRLTNLDPFSQLREHLQRNRLRERHRLAAPNALLESEGLLRQLIAPFFENAAEIPERHQRHLQMLVTVLNYIDEHLDEPLDLSAIARIAGMHPTYFSDLFRKMTGVRPISYLNKKRLERAQAMLLSTSMEIKEIADACGFQSNSYFCKMFKRDYGISPSAYRGKSLSG